MGTGQRETGLGLYPEVGAPPGTGQAVPLGAGGWKDGPKEGLACRSLGRPTEELAFKIHQALPSPWNAPPQPRPTLSSKPLCTGPCLRACLPLPGRTGPRPVDLGVPTGREAAGLAERILRGGCSVTTLPACLSMQDWEATIIPGLKSGLTEIGTPAATT